MTPGAESAVSADSTAGLRSSVGYRADVDGLRALAVIVVVAFHVGVPGFSGGFAGVDVFFAISGYLITGILWRSVSTTGSVDWRRFLVRRARRIIPLFAVVTLVSLLAACWLLVPDPELRSAGQSAAASSMFLANIFFYLKTYGYFAADVERLPLLHMWSLAVEEQFYLVWPIVIGGAGWLMRQRGPVARRRMVLGVVVGTTLVSFGAAWRLVGSNQSFAFYMMPTRAWELSAGGLLALYSDGRTLGRRSWSSAFLGAGGGLLLVAGFISLGSTSAFPGPRAVPFVFGTVLLISAGEFGGRGSPTKVLSWRPLALVGRLSYGWYLFHWPALVFVRIATAERNLWRDALIGVGTLGLAWMTHHLVERPLRSFRDSSVRVTRHTLVAAGAAIVVLGALGGIVAVRSTSLSQVEISPSAAAAMRENRTVSSTCADRLASEPEVRTCSFGSSAQQTLVLLGDSHALALMPAARTVADKLGLRLKVYWSTGCPYVGAYSSPPGAPSFHACTASNVAMSSELAAMSDVIQQAPRIPQTSMRPMQWNR